MSLTDDLPVLTSRFILDLGSKQLAFTKVSGIGVSTTVADTHLFAKGGRGLVKNPGAQEPTELVLTRQLDGETYLWDWVEKCVATGVSKENVANGSLILYSANDIGTEVVRYDFTDAWPSKIGLTTSFDATATGTVEEEVTLICNTFIRAT